MLAFPKFDTFAYLNGKIPTQQPGALLGTLGGLGAEVIPFKRRIDNLGEHEREVYEERAGIMQFGGAMGRRQAENAAYENVIYLQNYHRK